MKTLLLDIETAPNLAHVWGLWQQNVSLAQLRESSYMMCFAAKWHHTNEVHWYRKKPDNDITMYQMLYELLNEADAVVTYNGDQFDLPISNQELLLKGYPPPSPYKSIDLCKGVKKAFRFPSNKLDYVAQALGIGKKVEHEGHMLWVDCLREDPHAWERMRTYNIQDTVLLGPLHDKLLPWLPSYPNQQLYQEANSEFFCTRCGSAGIQFRGYATLLTGKYRRYRCNTCGAWSRSTKREETAGLVGV